MGYIIVEVPLIGNLVEQTPSLIWLAIPELLMACQFINITSTIGLLLFLLVLQSLVCWSIRWCTKMFITLLLYAIFSWPQFANICDGDAQLAIRTLLWWYTKVSLYEFVKFLLQIQSFYLYSLFFDVLITFRPLL